MPRDNHPSKLIYVAHSYKYDFKKELYDPIINSDLRNSAIFVFPHMRDDDFQNSKPMIRDCDLMIADIRYTSIGMGIEMGWANSHGKRIIGIVSDKNNYSRSASVVVEDVVEYSTDQDKFISDLRAAIFKKTYRTDEIDTMTKGESV